MKPKPLPTIETLNRFILYECKTGILYWKERSLVDFPCYRTLNTWNTRFSFQPVANRANLDGYIRIHLINETHLYHRILWKMHYQEEPIDIDHIDGNRFNNIITNLRSVTRADNNKNSSIRKDNTSGTTGIYKLGNKWRVNICVNEQIIELGIFREKAEAIVARKSAEIKYGFHFNHGKDK